jgi:hypothetical protein
MIKRNFVTCIYLKGNHFIKLKDNEKIREYDKLLKKYLEHKELYLNLLKEKDEYIKKLEMEILINKIENKY